MGTLGKKTIQHVVDLDRVHVIADCSLGVLIKMFEALARNNRPVTRYSKSNGEVQYRLYAANHTSCAFFHTRPGKPSSPPRLHASSNTSTFTSTPTAPLTSTATPLRRVGSNVTPISTRPDMGGRSGEVIVTRARARGGGAMSMSVSVSKRLSVSGEGGGMGRWMFTGMLRGVIVPECGRMGIWSV